MVDFSSRRGGRDEAPRRGRDEEPRRESRDDDRGSERGSSRGSERGSSNRGSGSSSGFRYQGRDRAQLEKRQTQSSNDYDKILKEHIKVWTPKEGNNRVRILPATWPEPDHYGYDIYVHYGVGPDRGSYLDLEKMRGEPDPITEERNELKRTGGASEEEIKKMDSKKRVLVYIIDRDEESEGVQAWPMAWTLDRDITVLSVDSQTRSVINIDDPEHGYDIEFRRDGKGERTKYIGIAVARRESRLGKSEWLDYAIDNPLPDQLQYFTYDEIAKTFGGGGQVRERDDRPDDDDGRSSGSRGVGRDDRDRGNDAEGRGASDRGMVGRGNPRERSRDDDRGRVEEPEITWASVHGMTGEELDALCESDDRLSKINPKDAKDDAELIAWICEDLNLKDEPPPSTRRRVAVEPASADRKLAEMRGRRNPRPDVAEDDIPY